MSQRLQELSTERAGADRRRGPMAIGLVLLLVASGLALAHLGHSPPTAHAAPPATAGPAVQPAAAYPTSIRHVVTVVLENANAATVFSQGPFERYLVAKYGYASHYYGVCHPSAPNYLSMTAGEPLQCGSDNYNVYNTTNIADLVEGAGLSWGAYAEGMPSACDTSNSGYYAVRHVPLLYNADIVNNTTRCDNHIHNFNSWNQTVANGTIPNYAFISPNKLDDGHDTNVSYADSWLKGWLSPLVNDSFFSSTVVFVVYDEAGSDNSGYNGTDGGRVYLSAVGPAVRANSTFSANASHFNLLSTTEWLLGLGGTGHNDSTSKFPAMKSWFNTSSAPSDYAVSGTVTANGTGTPLAGATVAASGGPSTGTNSTGAYSLPLANGTYDLTASAPGYLARTASVTVAGAPLTHDFALSPAPPGEYSLSGLISSAATGLPVSGASVALSGGSSTTSAGDGTYAFTVVNGSYVVTVTDPGYQARSAGVSIAGADVTQDFALALFVYDVNGTVKDPSGTGIANASVAVSGGSSYAANSAGQYLVQLGNGSYTLTASAAGYVDAQATVVIAGTAQTQDFVLHAESSATYAIRGTVTFAENGSPIAGATVRMSPGGSTTTLADGTYHVQVLNGTYGLSASAPGRVSMSRTVTVDGQAVEADFALSAYVYLVSGVVSSGATGQPIAGANVSWATNDSMLTDDSGVFSFRAANGSYTLQFAASGYASSSVSISVHGRPVLVNTTLTPTVTPSSPQTNSAPYLGMPSWAFLAIVLGAIVAATGAAIALSRRRRARIRPDGRR